MESFSTRYSPLVSDIYVKFCLNTKIFTFLYFCTKSNFVKIALESMKKIKMGLPLLATAILFLNLPSDRELIRVKR